MFIIRFDFQWTLLMIVKCVYYLIRACINISHHGSIFIRDSQFGRSIEPIDGIDDLIMMNSRDWWIVLFGEAETQVEPKGRSIRNNLFSNSSIQLFNYVWIDLEPRQTEKNETFHIQSDSDNKISEII